MSAYETIDTSCTLFAWVLLSLFALGITVAVFNYYGWRAFWEIPKRIFLALVAWAVADLIKAVGLLIIALPLFALCYLLAGHH